MTSTVATSAPGRRAPGRGAAARRRPWATAAVVVAVAAVLSVPTRELLAQRGEIARTADEVAELERANDALRDRRARLSDPAEVQRAARREFGLVGVGEESYSILPPPTAGLVLPNSWPFDRIAGAVARAAAQD